ncbi:hypothetical protein [Pseudomonas protegens]|uniref:hypothetical protein n=1 Tax=Pseudomonas protegens TaxID=380021 RepID=UPI0005A14D89|nr:hypothetical protein [Pseudomonas protegens]MBP5109973.1 hypothetical protein [Pseudomonas protegens]QTU28585.1 hypothetical protein HUT21_30710 [Pseudomonas protegens]QTU32219.1 hypothetical protein HUT20_17340 [Pseudomonas protegens]RLO19738.1 hypothetical protein EAG75_30345 [Pseudomonas protegens]
MNVAGSFQPDAKRGLLCKWPWLRQIVVVGAALLPTLSWGGMSCQGPDCPGILTMLAFFLGAFVLANILGALWMIGRKIKSVWRRWRDPNGREACEPPATDDAPGH